MLPWPPVRAQPDTIPAPPFPRELPWLNVAPLRMDKQRGRPVLIEFWDFCRVNSLRTMPYLKAWHERYPDLRVIGVHAGGFLPARDEANVRRAVERLAVPYPVVIDAQLELWDLYGNEGWPARYLWDTRGALFSMHYGEGAYEETEREIQELLGIEQDPLPPLRPEDEPGAAAARPDRGPAGRLQRAVRGRRRVGGARGRGRGGRGRAARSRCPSPAASSSSRTRTTRPRVLDLRVGAGRHVPRHLLHPGCRSSA